jgi:hypothetical protein
LEGEVCHADTGTLDAGTHHAHIHAEWDPYYPAGLLPFARLRLDVSGEGTPAGEGTAEMDFGGEWTTTMLWEGGAMAAIECGYTYARCDEFFVAPCMPTLEPESLAFVLPHGLSGQQVISAAQSIPDDWGPNEEPASSSWVR